MTDLVGDEHISWVITDPNSEVDKLLAHHDCTYSGAVCVNIQTHMSLWPRVSCFAAVLVGQWGSCYVERCCPLLFLWWLPLSQHYRHGRCMLLAGVCTFLDRLASPLINIVAGLRSRREGKQGSGSVLDVKLMRCWRVSMLSVAYFRISRLCSISFASKLAWRSVCFGMVDFLVGLGHQ